MKWLKKVAATPLTSIARVVDSLSNTTNDRTNAPSIHAVREAVNNNWLSIYPIGSIYMSVNNVNPSTIFGGTWEQIKDKFLLASGDTYNNGATGGAVTHRPTGTIGSHSLRDYEIPPHFHNIKTTGLMSGNSGEWGTGIAITGGNNYSTSTYGEGKGHSHTFTGDSQDTMPPYLAVNVWVRTA